MSPSLTLPEPRDPEVSVLLVTFNAWEWTERSLRALAEGTDPVFETIVVDNLSTDGTRERLSGVAGPRVVLNAANVGFGAAASQAALLARAPRLLFLNSDAAVVPGWLPPMLATLDASPDVAAVSPRLLHVDGRLQEAGSMVWGEGACDNYGDGDDPMRPEYLFRREVDYASAACLLVRAQAFADAGGFDDEFHPAYYEDVDLAMRWGEAGRSVVYEPRSTAVHRRWASSGDRSGIVDVLLANREVFLRRWSVAVGDRPPRPGAPTRADLTAIRDARCSERLLVVAAGATSRPGLAALVAGDAAAARPWWRVTLLDVAPAPGAAAVDGLREEGVEVVAGDADAARSFLEGRPGHHTAVLAAADVPEAILDAVRATQGQTALGLLADRTDRAAASAGSGAPAWAAGARAVVTATASAQPAVEGGVARIAWGGGGAQAVTALARVLGLAG